MTGMRICIVAGSGGVGKTTTSAAIAMGLAAEGRRVAVVTIDPARRLASALGIELLGNEPHLVDPAIFEQAGIEMRGELWALMLDPKRTFDDLIELLAPDSQTREEIYSNRIYRELSSAVAGSQEFTAIAKLYDLDRNADFDVIVLDTPPSRNALDFLDAPDRLSGFLEGRALKLLLAPTGIATKLLGRPSGIAFGLLRRLTGVDLLTDVSGFFRALSGLLDGFNERAAGVAALLTDPATTFMIVTSPQREPVEEAIYFHGKLRESAMPFGGLIVNRVTTAAPSEAIDSDALTALLGPSLARKVALAAADAGATATRDRRAIERLQRELDVSDPIVVPQLEGDVHDVAGLARIARHLFAG